MSGAISEPSGIKVTKLISTPHDSKRKIWLSSFSHVVPYQRAFKDLWTLWFLLVYRVAANFLVLLVNCVYVSIDGEAIWGCEEGIKFPWEDGFALYFSSHTQFCWSNNLSGGGSLSNTHHSFHCWSGCLILLKLKSLIRGLKNYGVMLLNLVLSSLSIQENLFGLIWTDHFWRGLCFASWYPKITWLVDCCCKDDLPLHLWGFIFQVFLIYFLIV